MRILAWDTSTRAGAVAAARVDDQGSFKVVAEWSLGVENTRHSERLLWGIHQTLEAAGWRLADVDAFGVGVGPGSFTGLRIGITTARTLARQTKKPLVGVSSLAVLARPAAEWLHAVGLGRTLVVAVREAFQGEVFALWGEARAVRRCVSQDLWHRGVHEEALDPALLTRRIRGQGRWMIVGDGESRIARKARLPVPPLAGEVQGRYAALLAWEALSKGQDATAEAVRPRYLRESSAEIKLKAGLLPQHPKPRA